MTTSIIPSPAVGGKESYSLTIYDIQNQFIGKCNYNYTDISIFQHYKYFVISLKSLVYVYFNLWSIFYCFDWLKTANDIMLIILLTVAFTTTFTSQVTEVLHEWGSLYVFTKDNKFYRLDENDTQTKLETLFKKNLYPTAIK